MCRLDMSLQEHLRIEEEKEAELPICPRCGEHIVEGYGYEVEPWSIWCEECAEDWLQKQRREL